MIVPTGYVPPPGFLGHGDRLVKVAEAVVDEGPPALGSPSTMGESYAP